jgi:hypothetical protein
VEQLVKREHPDPHAVLGAHPITPSGVVIRAHRPDAESVTALLEDAGGRAVPLALIHPGGVFEGTAEGASLPLRYRLRSTTATVPPSSCSTRMRSRRRSVSSTCT